MRDWPYKKLSCRKAQGLIHQYMTNDPGLLEEDRFAFEDHIYGCPKCADIYDQDKRITIMLLEYWKLKDPSARIRDPKSLARRPMTRQESWADLRRRSPQMDEWFRQGEEEEKLKRSRIRWAASIAACFVISTVLCWLSWNTQTDQDSKSNLVAKISPSEPTLAADNSVGGLESSHPVDDGPPTAVVREDIEDVNDTNI